ncbi:peptide ABC transporter substrate-binding protein [Arenibaculum pallidiluteum]|uniref:peptide ABC transporter substrate-binding protein n=1 Tax=Arenibaculum pallidiluteum TaxID=2812559 RepID=UPI001F27C909|nr:peptide ABC transporter substrate-binding protein [Arenibaculum pallidiluteum]
MQDIPRMLGRLATGLALGIALTAAAMGVAQAEVVLRRGNGAEPATLDTHKSTGVPESYIQMDLFEGLLASDPEAKPIPGAAESWTISDDGTVYTFKLRSDAKWSDGSPVTAEDFVFSWRRLADPATASQYAFFIWPVKNGEAITKGEMPPDALAVEAVDQKTLKVTLRAPTPYFLSAQLHHALFPVSKANVEKFGADYLKPGNLVSNGAYTLAEHVPQSHVKLVKNPAYYGAKDVKVDTVYFYVTEDIDAELKRFRAGDLDATYEMPPQQIPWAKANMADSFRAPAYLGSYYYAFNLTHEPWKSNAKLRKAVSLAVDREILVEKITQAGELPAYGFVPPGIVNYQSATLDYAGMPQKDRDALAKKLFAEAGYGPGKPLDLEIFYNTNDRHKKIAIAVGGMLKQKLGINTTLTNQEWKVYLDARNQKTYKDVIRVGWIGDYNDPNTFLELLRGDIGPQNPAAYDNPRYNELLSKAGRTADLQERGRIMTEAEALMLEDHPIIPLYYYTRPLMVASYVKGWQDNILNYHPTRFITVQK